MRHNRTGIAVVAGALALAGCFDAHGLERDVDAGPPLGDGGAVVRDCGSAMWAPEGAACDFDDVCRGFDGECGPPSTIQCVEGRIRVLRPICTRALPTNCDEYLRYGDVPGAFCLSSEFEGCTIREGDCCARRIACVDDAITDDTVCGDCDPGFCPGYAPPPPELPGCTSSSDCESFPCAPAGTPRGCGICREPVRACEDDAGCAPGQVCVEETDPCSCGGAGTACVMDCRTAESDPCGEEARCGASGACEVIDCGAGWACPLNTRCHAASDGARDAHGCGRIACDAASDCDCGVCMDGVCQDGPGVCLPPVP